MPFPAVERGRTTRAARKGPVPMSTSTTTTDRPPVGAEPALSALLREATAEQHTRAETSGFVTALMRGDSTREAYVDLARQHHAIYAALERAASGLAADPRSLVARFPELPRTAALEADLTALAGPDWRDRPLASATLRYVERLDVVASAWSGHYLAHAYTRYLGDLSGGQIVRTMLQRHYALAPEHLGFYHFADVPKPKVFKDRYRQAMDDAGYDAPERAAIAAESRVAFDLNTALFADLGRWHPVVAG